MWSLIRFLTNYSLLVAGAAAILTLGTFLISGSTIRPLLVCEVFFLTWLAYLFLRREGNSSILRLLILFAAVGSFVFAALTDFIGWPILLCGILAVLFYNFSSDKFQSLPSFILRQIVFLKSPVVGIAWALTTSALPTYMASDTHEFPHGLMTFSNFFFITGLAIVDDIKDMKLDHGNIKTLPMVIGINASKILVFVHFILASLFFYSTAQYHNSSINIGYFFAMLLTVAMVFWIRPTRDRTLQALLIDGSILLRGLVIAVLSIYGA